MINRYYIIDKCINNRFYIIFKFFMDAISIARFLVNIVLILRYWNNFLQGYYSVKRNFLSNVGKFIGFFFTPQMRFVCSKQTDEIYKITF